MQINTNYERGPVMDWLPVKKDEILKNCGGNAVCLPGSLEGEGN